MKAIRFHDYGGPEVMKYEEVAKPSPKEDEILVRVHAVSVNPVDWKIREGHVRKRIQIPLPGTPGGDLSGVVEQAGSAVAGFKAGDPVFAHIGLLGAYADYVVIKPQMAAPKPARMDHVQAASVPLAGLTAWQALFGTGGLKAGQRVLVQAAAGGVGMFAVQFARQAGAEVVGTCSAANAEFVRGLGASRTIDYRSESFEPYARSFDLVLDSIGGETGLQSLGLLKPGGILVGVAPPGDAVVAKANESGLRAVGMMVRPDGESLAKIARLIDAGEVTTSVAAVFPLAEAGRAHEQIKLGHTRGKIVLRTGA